MEIIENIKITELLKLLPENYKNACFEHKAIERSRVVKSPEELLALLMYYLGADNSLIAVSQYALLVGIGKISDVALIKKFNKCCDWLKWLIENIKPNEIINYKKPIELEDYNVIAVDASDIREKGAVNREWHLHYGVNLFSLTCNQFKITEQSTGETLKNFNITKNDLIIGDRAYATISSIEYCLKNGGNFILRIRNKAFNLYNENKEKIVLADWLQTLDDKVSECTVYMKNSEKQYIPLRICAVPKTEEEIKIEEKKIQRRDSKKQMKTSYETKFTHRYMFVITSLPSSISAEKVLEFYRLRWQVELVFKRYKSLLNLGNIPTKTEKASEVWLNGKMLIALLIEKYLGDIDFSPSWKLRKESEFVEGNQTCITFDDYKYITE